MSMRQVSNWHQYKTLRQKLRREPSPAENRLWWYLQHRRFLGYKFRRQQGLGRYVVDFYCPELNLAIELDGDSHFDDTRRAYDQQRQQWLERIGVRVVRFRNDEVLQAVDVVLDRLRSAITTPNPSS